MDNFPDDPIILQLQEELAKCQGRLVETTAGQRLDWKLLERISILEAKIQAVETESKHGRRAWAYRAMLEEKAEKLKTGRARFNRLAVCF